LWQHELPHLVQQTDKVIVFRPHTDKLSSTPDKQERRPPLHRLNRPKNQSRSFISRRTSVRFAVPNHMTNRKTSMSIPHPNRFCSSMISATQLPAICTATALTSSSTTRPTAACHASTQWPFLTSVLAKQAITRLPLLPSLRRPTPRHRFSIRPSPARIP
jgi:hypothetical protein